MDKVKNFCDHSMTLKELCTKGKKTKFVRSFFGRIYGAPICLLFYLTFSSWCFGLVFLIATEYLTKKLYFYIQMCNKTGTKWNYGEWLFTSKPGVFGMIGGCANPTGVALISILTIMVLCSLPCVRRSGRFEVSPFRI